MPVRTSSSDPILVSWFPSLLPGCVGITIAPGKHQASKSGAPWARDLSADLDRLTSVERATTLVTLLEEAELARLRIDGLVAEAEARGLEVLRLPIPDGGVLSGLAPMTELVDRIAEQMRTGKRVVVHCAGGLGRSGTVVGCLLVRLGMSADEALHALTRHRSPQCPETEGQRAYIRQFAREVGPAPARARPYQTLLPWVVALVQQASERLREEFYRPGGPRRRGKDAEIDAEVDALLCEQLTQAHPTHGLYSEEGPSRRRAPSDPEKHCWLVDPNDGTSWFVDGYRGSAVSVALLRDGVPVLGVVHAYAAGGPQGDLFAWAEGEPLTRNGHPVSRAWPSALTADHTVLVSPDADLDDRPRKAAARARPARFRALPSIAYRLALVAAGEGDVATSRNGPVGYDYAAGHALLRGAGGELFDAHGHVVTYATSGESSCHGACFGGTEALVSQVRAASKAPALPAPEAGPWKPCYPSLERRERDEARLDRALGCMMGQCIGDALGQLVEFEQASAIERRYPGGPRRLHDGGTWGTLAGQPTDDTELALCLARSLASTGVWDEETTARAYACWLASGPFDVGSTTRQALDPARKATAAGASAAEAARASANHDSAANGALMRVSPLGVFGHAFSADFLDKLARADARLTHPNPACQAANALFCRAIALAVGRGASATEVYQAVVEASQHPSVPADVRAAIRAAASAPPAHFSRQQGWVLIALQNAFYQLLHAPSAAEGLIDTVRRGGDTDTNGAIAAALLGAVHGALAWPIPWRDRVLSCRPFAGLAGVEHPRPRCFWPVDLPALTESLLVQGAEAARTQRQPPPPGFEPAERIEELSADPSPPFGSELGIAFARYRGLQPAPRLASDAFRFELGQVVERRDGQRASLLGYAFDRSSQPRYLVVHRSGTVDTLDASDATHSAWHAIDGHLDPKVAAQFVDADGQPCWLSGPYRAGALTLFLLHAPASASPGVLSLGQALAQGSVSVHETGTVDALALDNGGPLPVLCLLGDLVKGGQQDRVVREPLVVAPGSLREPVPVRCVEAGRWSPRGDEPPGRFASTRGAPARLRRLLASGGDQQQVWSEVAQVQERLGRRRGTPVRDPRSTSSLPLSLEDGQIEQASEELLRPLLRLPQRASAVGYVAAMHGSLRQAEWFASAELFLGLWPSLLRGLVLETLEEDGAPSAAPPGLNEVSRWLTAAREAPVVSRTAASAGQRQRRAAGPVRVVETLWPEDEPLHVFVANV